LSPPLISIVTPTYNRAEMLTDAIESVRAQNYPAVEHIIVDGGSTDRTLELLARYGGLHVISEPDRGVYDALNKGLRLAKGEIIGHLNSDDVYTPSTFAAVATAFEDPQVESVVGGCEIFEKGDLGQMLLHRFTGRETLDLTFENVTLGVAVTNARFFRRSIYEKVGYTDLRYPIASDRDFLFRVALAAPKTVVLDQVVYRYRQHAGSLTINGETPNEPNMRAEYLDIAEDLLKREMPDRARQTLLHWHRRESAKQAIHYAKRIDISNLTRVALRGQRLSPGWIGECAGLLAAGLRARIRGGSCT
jgi:glycosyltransferase involved in cell wall biosynthesis